MRDLRLIARFHAPAPLGMEAHLTLDEVRARLVRSEGPAPLAVDVHEVLRQQTDGVEEVQGVTAVGGGFLVRRGRRAVRVLAVWLGPPQGLWILSIFPVRKYRKRRRVRDLTLAGELQPLLDRILDDHPEVSHVVWMTEDEAAAYPL